MSFVKREELAKQISTHTKKEITVQVECVFDARWNDEKVSKGVAILFFFNRYWKVVKICEGCISYFRIKRRLAIKVSRSKRRSKKRRLFSTRGIWFILSTPTHSMTCPCMLLSCLSIAGSLGGGGHPPEAPPPPKPWLYILWTCV